MTQQRPAVLIWAVTVFGTFLPGCSDNQGPVGRGSSVPTSTPVYRMSAEDLQKEYERMKSQPNRNIRIGLSKSPVLLPRLAEKSLRNRHSLYLEPCL